MSVLNTAMRQFIKLRLPRIERFIKRPVEVQQWVFHDLIYKAKRTEWGQQYDYESIRSPLDFRNRIPVGDYDTHKPYINRMMHGEQNVLWRGRIKWFSKSSGTTNDKSKYLPVSKVNLKKCHLRGGMDLLSLYYKSFPNATIFSGKGLGMGGSYERFQPYPKTRFGDVSAIMISHIPNFIKPWYYTPPDDIALMSEWEAKIERMAQHVIHQDIRNIGGVPTWMVVLFRRILDITGKANMLEVWPNMEVCVHGGVSFEPYRKQFETFFPSNQVKFFEAYNASEGFFASQAEPYANDMLLLLDNGIFYEFIPMREWGKAHPQTVQLEDVKIGENYALVISTNAGLWRYQNGDTITFTSKNPFKIKITGRTKHFINAFGEEVMVANTDKAIAMTCEQTQAVVSEYTVAPIYFAETQIGKGGHDWLVEFSQKPASLEQFIDLLDKNLQTINSDYEAKRYKNMALERLQLKSIPQNTFHNWLKSKGKYGGQHKVPRLSNDRRYLEDILEFMRSEGVGIG